MIPDQPLTWNPRLRNMACELYRGIRVHKSRLNRLVEAGLAGRMENGKVYLKPHVCEAMKRMFGQ